MHEPRAKKLCDAKHCQQEKSNEKDTIFAKECTKKTILWNTQHKAREHEGCVRSCKQRDSQVLTQDMTDVNSTHACALSKEVSVLRCRATLVLLPKVGPVCSISCSHQTSTQLTGWWVKENSFRFSFTTLSRSPWFSQSCSRARQRSSLR